MVVDDFEMERSGGLVVVVAASIDGFFGYSGWISSALVAVVAAASCLLVSFS
jgi:hypothetical protein